MNNNIITINQTADILGVSDATVRNWIKAGNLKPVNTSSSNFSILEVNDIKNKIEQGQILKLNSRANKSNTEKTFLPMEYLKIKNENLFKIIEFIKKENLDISTSLFYIALNILEKEKILQIKDNLNFLCFNKQINKELDIWRNELNIKNLSSHYSFLLSTKLPIQKDILGFIYQSLLLEGHKSKNGSYYTPEFVVNEITEEYVEENFKVLDPCCGTGQFLLAFAEKINNPENIYGFDIDEIAIKIARLNILIKYKNKDFIPNIFHKNFLLDIQEKDLFDFKNSNENIANFDFIATNPPWGFYFSNIEKKQLQKYYPTIKSFESFSYFLQKSCEILKLDGKISFILPESILHVKTHKDIRKFILENTQIKKIHYLKQIFKNVFSSVIRIDMEKTTNNKKEIDVLIDNKSYKINQNNLIKNNNFVFNIFANNIDLKIIDKIYALKHTTLAGQADWALGIVTGNNNKYLSDKKSDIFNEEIYKGKDVNKFIFNSPSTYINFQPEKFQQIAPLEKYKAKEKLIYKFISKYLVFAYDDKQKLTLNSANILIPNIPNYPIKIIAGFFNSSVYQFLFQKKFASIKILRNQLEQLPLPILEQTQLNEMMYLVDKTIIDNLYFKELDLFIMNIFNFTEKEKEQIWNF